MPDKKTFSLKKILEKHVDVNGISEPGCNQDKVPTPKKEEYKPVAEDSAKIKPIKINDKGSIKGHIKDEDESLGIVKKRAQNQSDVFLKIASKSKELEI